MLGRIGPGAGLSGIRCVCATAATLAALIAVPGASSYADEVWSLSCSRQGSIIHEATLAGDAPAAVREQVRERIAKRFPGSMCVALRGEPRSAARVAAHIAEDDPPATPVDPGTPDPPSDLAILATALSVDMPLGTALVELVRTQTTADSFRSERDDDGAAALRQALSALSGEIPMPEGAEHFAGHP